MSLLSVEGVVAGYGRHDAILKGVSIDVEDAEIVALLGPNGAGKSTLLRAIAGVIPAREGRMLFAGIELSGMPPREVSRRGIAYVPQEANIFPSLTIAENLEVGGYLDRREIQTRRERVYDTIPDLRSRRAATGRSLSGGQRQMLAVGMAMMVAPRLLLLDEPSAGLSPVATEQLFGLLGSINREGVAIALVEQNALAALEVAQRAYILVDGRVSRAGPARSLATDSDIRSVFLGG